MDDIGGGGGETSKFGFKQFHLPPCLDCCTLCEMLGELGARQSVRDVSEMERHPIFTQKYTSQHHHEKSTARILPDSVFPYL